MGSVTALSLIVGMGLLWLGGQIVWVAPLPRQLRKLAGKEVPVADKGSEAAFGLFWLDQYGWLGICLSIVGLVLVLRHWLG